MIILLFPDTPSYLAYNGKLDLAKKYMKEYYVLETMATYNSH
jgi:hypothetical protein